MTPRIATAAVAVHPAIFRVRDGVWCLDNKNAVTAAAAAPPLSLGAVDRVLNHPFDEILEFKKGRSNSVRLSSP